MTGARRDQPARPRRRSGRLRRLLPALLLLPLLAAPSGCATGAAAAPGPAGTLRLGYLADITHATALIGVHDGVYARDLARTRLTSQVFQAGPDEMTALLGGHLDAAYVGPSSALNAYVRSHGQALRIVAGATLGGAELVVRPGLTSPSQLRGKTLATPQLGNTQDVALRYWLSQQGYHTDPSGSGDVAVVPESNATTLEQFRAGRIDGAWVPEPWASRLVVEGGGHVLVDERSLWPGGRFATTVLVVATSFLTAHPQTVTALLAAQLDTEAWIAAHPATARTDAGQALTELTGSTLQSAELTRAWAQLTLGHDPVMGELPTLAAHAAAVGFGADGSVTGIYALQPLDELLAARPTNVASGPSATPSP
ncbi:ABC transporter substrate-binding protein [Streptacidiphilus melanogenes]|uniref:ABC transporter substrate-binding protein n=1 Tax=Streptacidiphilus melanogenes TaxID=411235 RepID=UPI0006947198|nr:ABC transporter substrate-binding protein [Streptacidiphilus melanogenes]